MAASRKRYKMINSKFVGADQYSYTSNSSTDTCIIENVGFEITVFEKSTLNRMYSVCLLPISEAWKRGKRFIYSAN